MSRLLLAAVLVCAAKAQLPPVGDIHVYGLHQLKPETILSAAGIETGRALPSSKGETEEKLAQAPGIAAASLQSECCESGAVTLYIGVQEAGQPVLAFHASPTGDPQLPDELLTAYSAYEGALLVAAGKDTAADVAAKAFEPRFTELARKNVAILRDVVRNSWDHEQRKAAATLLGYAPLKKSLLDDLMFAVGDPDPEVRANAVCSVQLIAAAARRRPALGIRVSPAPFVDLLNSVVLSDRERAAGVLFTLTATRTPAMLTMIRQRGAESLAEMARWPSARYARTPFLLLGRLTPTPDLKLRQAWDKGDREPIIARALGEAPAVTTTKPTVRKSAPHKNTRRKRHK